MGGGTVKFFNTTKGFGFIAPDGGGDDVFVHVSAVERAGLAGLNEGDVVTFELETDRRSGKLSAGNLSLVSAGSASSRPGRGGPRSFERADDPSRPARTPAGTGTGLVKWFNPAKGFGFIAPDTGGDDVFVHVSAVERAGLHGLAEGQRLNYEIEQDRRSGKTSATNLRLDD